MKYSIIFSTIALASLSTCAPVEDKRQTTPVSAITTDLTDLQMVVNADTAAINQAAASVKNNVGASLAVAAAINANLQAIAAGLEATTAEITSVTTGAAGGVAASTEGLTQTEINQLATDLTTAQYIVGNISASLTVTATDLKPATTLLISSEVSAVQALLGPFTAPLTTYASAAEKAGASASLTVTGLVNALTGLDTIVNSLITSLGAGGIGL